MAKKKKKEEELTKQEKERLTETGSTSLGKVTEKEAKRREDKRVKEALSRYDITVNHRKHRDRREKM